MTQDAAPTWPVLSWMRIVCLNTVFWTLLPLVTMSFLAVGVPYVLVYGVAVRSHRRTLRLIRRSISNYGAVILKCAWPLVRVEYVDLAPDDEPPFVYVSNHRSSSDGFLMAVLPVECIQVLNNWPSRLPIVGIVSRIAGYLRVRQMPFDEFVAEGSRLLGQGVSIITFPEGTRSGSRRIGPFHGSAFRLAQRAGVKIAPLAIWGNENIPSRGSLVLHPGRIVVSKLPAITAEQYRDMSPYTLKTMARDRIRRHLEAQPA